MYVNFVLLI